MDGLSAVQIRGLIGQGLRRLADLIVPPQCLICRERVLEPGSLCGACWQKLVFIEEPCCDRLGVPFAYDQGESAVSAAAEADPPPWNRARAAVAFNDTARELIHALKYRDRHEAALIMARLMARAAQSILPNTHAVVPVPLHRRRLWRRRYNQSALLGRHLALLTGCRFAPEVLVRQRPTRQQVGLDHEERRKNVRRAFTVPAHMSPFVTGQNLLLVDDVLTTGATASAATEALRRAGARRVDVLTFALVLEPKRLHI
jgi:ComF family protein